MKLRVVQEKKNLYFAELVGVEGAYVQAETPDLALESLWDVYQQILLLKKEYVKEKFLKSSLSRKLALSLLGSSFKKLELSL